MFAYALAGIAIAVAVIFLKSGKKISPLGENAPPSEPWALPIIGNAISMMSKGPENVHKALAEIGKKHGGICSIMLGPLPAVLVQDPNLLREIFLDREGVFSGRQHHPNDSFFQLVMKNSLMSTDGEYYKNIKGLFMTHLYSADNFGQRLIPTIEREALKTMQHLRSLTKDGQSVTLRPLLRKYCLNSVWEPIISKTWRMDSPDMDTMFSFMDTFFNISPTALIMDNCPWLRFINIPYHFTVKKIQKDFDTLLLSEVTNRRESFMPSTSRDFVDELFAAGLDDKTIAAQLFIMLTGGVDTPTAALEWVVLRILKYPKIQAQIQAEIDTMYRANTSPSYYTMKQSLPYLSASIKETLRVNSVASGGIPHRVMEDTKLGGYDIPRDTTLMYVLEDFETEDSDFNPERYFTAGENTKIPVTVKQDKHEFFPFGAGARTCIGHEQAQVELTVFVAYLFRYFNVEYTAGKKVSDSDKFQITVVPKTPVTVKLSLRSSAFEYLLQ